MAVVNHANTALPFSPPKAFLYLARDLAAPLSGRQVMGSERHPKSTSRR
jgi:hypothetical protein